MNGIGTVLLKTFWSHPSHWNRNSLSVSLVTLLLVCACNKLHRLYPYVGFTNDFSKRITLIYYSMDLLCSNYPGAKPRFSSLDNGTNFKVLKTGSELLGWWSQVQWLVQLLSCGGNLVVLKRILVFAIRIVASLTIEYRIIGQYSSSCYSHRICQGDGSKIGSAWTLFRHDKLM